MHELSIAVSVLESVEAEIASRSGGTPRGSVREVTMRIGRLAGIEPEALSFAWEVARRGTICDGAELALDLAPVVASCSLCGSTFPIESEGGACGNCGPAAFSIVGGREIEIRRVMWEVEEEVR